MQSQASNLSAARHIETAPVAVATDHVKSAFDDSSKAAFGAAAVFLYWTIVILIWLVEEPVFGRHQLTSDGLTTFTIGALGVIVWLARLYWYPIALVGSILLSLTVLQTYAPTVTRTAPAGEILLTTFLTLFVCMCVTFVTRHSDRKMG